MFPDLLSIPETVLDIAKRLEDAGHETWCVGGAVRDNLLGLDNHDFDLATSALPDDVLALFRRTVPIGVEHGTVAVLDREGVMHEVTTFRRDVRTDGRRAEVEFGASLDQDLARRDFTINAIAYHPFRRGWHDPFGGAADLERRLIRAVGDPAARFREDYLRIARGLRFAARFGFAIEPDTWRAACDAATGLDQLSAERVRDEWFKGLATAKRVRELVDLWHQVGGLREWLPEVTASTENTQAADRLPGRDPVLITCVLSADPETTLTRLKCSKQEIERGRRVGRLRTLRPERSTGAPARRWVSTIGDAAEDLASIASAFGDDMPRHALEEVLKSGVPLRTGDLAVGGGDVLAAGVVPGPQVGQILQMLLDDVLDAPEHNETTYLTDRIRELAEGGE